MKIGLFGGAFNPVHTDHLTIAHSCLDRLELDRLLLIPNSFPPHKDTCKVSYAHRRAMLELVIRDEPRLEICDIEQDPHEKHYSFKTCETLRANFGPDCRLFFIMGADSLLYLDEWYRGLELITLANLVVTNRVGYELKGLKPVLQDFVRRCHTELPNNPASENFRPQGGLYLLNCPLNEVSSSSIRLKLQQGQKPVELAAEVYAYIRAQHLYEE
ncbi:MAG: nicotinate (nicotinamide) nucleotide adenylyltransferase [Succinivibrio sp.]|nr:nicotinate (nicotinamide) nucleotide adenylyltransferase [Succinivibrio sp.]